MFDSLFAAPVRSRVRVALPVPIDSLFDYVIGDDLSEDVQVGCRVQVPFSGRSLVGVVVEVLDLHAPPTDAVPGEVSRVEKILDTRPALDPEMIRILGEAAHDVLCPLGVALATALPPGSEPRIVKHFRLTDRGRAAQEHGVVQPDARPVLDALAEQSLTPTTLARRFPRSDRQIVLLERDGLIARRDVEARANATLRSERMVALAAGVDLEAVCDGPLARAPRQAALLRRIAADGPIATPALRAENKNNINLVRMLNERGYLVASERLAPRDVLGPPVARDRPLDLTDEQDAAFARIAREIDAHNPQRFLLHGVTGSGKTEVYLRAVARALEAGRQALLLVPEITLTHQLVARLRARFGDQLAVLHSGLSPSERLEQWQRLREGDTPIAVGARSALFAPLSNLGIIIIDEEHDGAYKNDEGFRYRAHDLVRRRAESAGCPVVLGSATPSLEMRYAAERGEIERLVLASRILGRPLPKVEVVDMARQDEIALKGKRSNLTGPLRRAIQETLDAKAQTILFLNRRGFSTQIYCFECGHAERCQHCEVSLVYHAGENILRCHYCDFRKPPPEKCDGCGQSETSLLGMGTERLEEEVRSLFPKARIARLDRDVAQRKGYTASVLQALHDREVDILIGTQMVAKGHDFPGVRLVGVVAADMGLHMPDFRAAERSFQLLTQVAGRAGRASDSGRVILQTYVPDHYAIKPVSQHDYETFYATEIEHRRGLSYPPFGRISQLVVSSRDEAEALRCAEAMAQMVRPPVQTDEERDDSARIESEAPAFEVLGPAPAPLARLRGRYRFQVLVKGSDAARVRTASEVIREALVGLPRSVRGSLDVDPVNML